MTVRRLVLVVAAVLLAVGVIALLVPVSISDGNVGCGNAVSADLAGAREANSKTVANVPILNEVVPHTDYVAQCQSSVSQRRAWSIPLAVIGVIGVAGALLVGNRGAVRADTR